MDVFDVINKKLEEKRQMLANALAAGSARDFAEVQFLVGQVRGLAAAQLEVSDLSKTMKEANED